MSSVRGYTSWLAALTVCWLSPPVVATAQTEAFAAVVQERANDNEAAARSQVEVDALSDATDELASEYRRTLQETKALKVYTQQVESLIAAQQKEMESLRAQIEEVTVIGRQVIPLMLRMIDTLEAFVGLDTPFLQEERRKRVADLRALMDRADVTISEKYRRILEAYQIENEYGRTIEAYRAPLSGDGETRTVDFLRVGRVALLYQTLDAQETGMWNPDTKRWTALADDYRHSVREGLRMARKQVAPDLVRIPVALPQKVTR